MFNLVWMLISVLQLRHVTTGYIETVTASGCESCRLYLTCRHLESVIAILDFEFESNSSDSKQKGAVFRNDTLANFSAQHPREILNHRCSGVNHCSFILTEDCPGTNTWGPGTLSVKYVCITEDKIGKYCNTDIRLPHEKFQGFLINPGYPRFYAGQTKCRWKITAPPKQKLKITLLDVSLLVDNVADPEGCTDVLTISDTGQVIFSTCRLEHPPRVVVSASETVEIVLSASNSFNPARRGVLLRYATLGCAAAPAPAGARLLRRDDWTAEYACAEGSAFPDTGASTRVLACESWGGWNESLPLLPCHLQSEIRRSNVIHQFEVPDKTAQIMGSELIAPALLMVALLVINAAVVFFINKARKRQALLIVNDEELGTFTSNTQEKQPN